MRSRSPEAGVAATSGEERRMPGAELSGEDPGPAFDVEAVRRDFPILARKIRGKPLVYLDNAASAQKPRAVIDALARVYTEFYANVHRGLHHLSELSTEAYEGARETVASYLNAASPREIVFTRGTTESINLVASSFGRSRFRAGDEVLLTGMEHHSNIVPWQLLRDELGIVLKVAPVTDRGELDLERLEELLSERTRLVSVVHVSNALGTVNPVPQIVELAHRRGVQVLVDGAQAVPHFPVDVRKLGCDFYAFSGHKAFGPSGVGALYGRLELLEEMPPYQGGGEMILSVRFDETTFKTPPFRFEAGTPNIAGAIGLGATLDYLRSLDLEAAARHEGEVLAHATAALEEIAGVRVIGRPREKAGVLSFVIDGVHAHDVGTVLDQEGIAVRAGHHCTQPLMERFGLAATARASFAFYNTRAEADRLAEGIRAVKEVFA